MRTATHPVNLDDPAAPVRRHRVPVGTALVIAATVLAGCSRDSGPSPGDDTSLAARLCREVEALLDLGADVRTIDAVVDFYEGAVWREQEVDPMAHWDEVAELWIAHWDEVAERCGPVERMGSNEHVRAAVQATDDPEAALARATCDAVTALDRAGADAGTILTLAIDDWYISMNLNLDDDRYQELTMEGCGPVILAAVEVVDARVDAREAASRAEASRIADQVVVAVDRCDDAGAEGTLTNTSGARLTYVGFLVVLHGEGGAIGGEPLWFGFGVPGGRAVDPGGTIAWSLDLEEHHRWNYGEVDEPVTHCVVEWVHVEDWE
jgi:hypothetical protein